MTRHSNSIYEIESNEEYILERFVDDVPTPSTRPELNAWELVALSHYRRKEYAQLYVVLREWRRLNYPAQLRLDSAMMCHVPEQMSDADNFAFASLFEFVDRETPLAPHELQYLERSNHHLWQAAVHGNVILITDYVPPEDERPMRTINAEGTKTISVMRKIDAVRRFAHYNVRNWFAGEFLWSEQEDGTLSVFNVLPELANIILGYLFFSERHVDTLRIPDNTSPELRNLVCAPTART